VIARANATAFAECAVSSVAERNPKYRKGACTATSANIARTTARDTYVANQRTVRRTPLFRARLAAAGLALQIAQAETAAVQSTQISEATERE
jgi:hypothetical protein